MKKTIRFRWIVAGLWIAATLVLFFLAPNLQELVAEKGQITVPEGYSSQEAQTLIDDMSENGERATSAVLVFHDEKGIDQARKMKFIKPSSN